MSFYKEIEKKDFDKYFRDAMFVLLYIYGDGDSCFVNTYLSKEFKEGFLYTYATFSTCLYFKEDGKYYKVHGKNKIVYNKEFAALYTKHKETASLTTIFDMFSL